MSGRRSDAISRVIRRHLGPRQTVYHQTTITRAHAYRDSWSDKLLCVQRANRHEASATALEHLRIPIPGSEEFLTGPRPPRAPVHGPRAFFCAFWKACSTCACAFHQQKNAISSLYSTTECEYRSSTSGGRCGERQLKKPCVFR